MHTHRLIRDLNIAMELQADVNSLFISIAIYVQDMQSHSGSHRKKITLVCVCVSYVQEVAR